MAAHSGGGRLTVKGANRGRSRSVTVPTRFLGQDRKGADVLSANRREVLSIECDEQIGVQSLGERDRRSIGATERNVAVRAHELGGARSIVRLGSFDLEIAK